MPEHMAKERIRSMSTMVSESADTDALRQCLEHALPDIVGERSAITGIHRRRSDCSTSYSSEIVTLQLATGQEFRIFLKDFGFSQLAKDGMEQRRERELRVYQDLLVQAGLGTAKYYGSVWDEAQRRFWLLLEFVDGVQLRYCDGEYWIAAAGWLGRMHGFFAQHSNRLHAYSFLLRHDGNFFLSKAELALRAVSLISTVLADRLTKILNRYEPLVDVMTSQAPTLVHGSYRPLNILADPNSEPLRVCPIDWELAAFGAPLYDLAFISGSSKAPTLDRLWDAYREGAAAYDMSLSDRNDMRYIVDCFHLHRIIKSLSESLNWKRPESTVAKLVDRGEELSNLLLSELG